MGGWSNFVDEEAEVVEPGAAGGGDCVGVVFVAVFCGPGLGCVGDEGKVVNYAGCRN